MKKLSELLEKVKLKEISWNILPNHISLGTLETDYLINITTQNKEVSNEELNSIKKQIADLVYPKKNIDEITDEFINNFNPTDVTSQFEEVIEDGEKYLDFLDECDFKQALLLDFTNNYMNEVTDILDNNKNIDE